MSSRKRGQVLNKAPAAEQITAEQIVREAMELGRELAPSESTRERVTDLEELEAYRLRRRTGFEGGVRRNRYTMSYWVAYAVWEARQKEFERARSVFERALEVNHRDPQVWEKYATMEMKNRFVNMARNVWNRAVGVLPRVDALWYKFAFMEEMLGNVAGARQVFERWMDWRPPKRAWQAYIKLELRHDNVERARHIYERFVLVHREPEVYQKYAWWEERQGNMDAARRVYERAMDELDEDKGAASMVKLTLNFAEFEERCKEYERARAIYKFCLDNVQRAEVPQIYSKYMSFEKQYGDRSSVEEAIMSRRRLEYEEIVTARPLDFDAWHEYTFLEEVCGDRARIRDVYARAVASVPSSTDKDDWRRYVYLWINLALYEELTAKDVERTRQVYAEALKIVPHREFTFAKLWLLAAEFEIRQRDLPKARQLLGTSIGMCPKRKLFRGYINLELQLGEIDRCRTLYEKYIEFAPENCDAWAQFADLELSMDDPTRARAIYELAIAQPVLDRPEMIWKAYIDLEIAHGRHDEARTLYERLLAKTQHVKVWISLAQFEASINEVERARAVFDRAINHFRQFVASASTAAKEDRVLLLEAWLDFEKHFGDDASVSRVRAQMPRRIKKRRLLTNDDGSEAGWEEYVDYIFPEEESSKKSIVNIMEKARQWKRRKLEAEAKKKQAEQAAAAAAAAAAEAAQPDDNES